MVTVVISDEAVEAAAKAYFRGHNWESLAEWYREQCLEFARAALEAAAPYMQLAELPAGVQREIDEVQTMTEVLVDHQRQNSSSCLCGWAELGKSHPEHQAAALSAAGFGPVQEPSYASVWDEAVTTLYMGNAINQDHMTIMWERNPYRSQA